jgi:hypothetical protein
MNRRACVEKKNKQYQHQSCDGLNDKASSTGEIVCLIIFNTDLTSRNHLELKSDAET